MIGTVLTNYGAGIAMCQHYTGGRYGYSYYFYIFFLVVLGGVFFGLFVGFGLIDFHEKHQEKKLMHKRKRRKKITAEKAAKENENRRQTGLKPKREKEYSGRPCTTEG